MSKVIINLFLQQLQAINLPLDFLSFVRNLGKDARGLV